MFKLLTFVLKFYPIVMIVIEIVEAFTKGRPGSEKKDLVMRVVAELASRFSIKLTATHLALISQIIDAIVATLNALGLFKHTDDLPETVLPVTVPPVVVVPIKSETDARLDELEAIFAR